MSGNPSAPARSISPFDMSNSIPFTPSSYPNRTFRAPPPRKVFGPNTYTVPTSHEYTSPSKWTEIPLTYAPSPSRFKKRDAEPGSFRDFCEAIDPRWYMKEVFGEVLRNWLTLGIGVLMVFNLVWFYEAAIWVGDGGSNEKVRPFMGERDYSSGLEGWSGLGGNWEVDEGFWSNWSFWALSAVVGGLGLLALV